MKAIILNGANDSETLEDVSKIIMDELASAGWMAEAFILREIDIRHCAGCFGCWVQTPGVCIINDAGRDVAKAIIQSDLVIYLTPVTFGGYSSQLKKVLDRSIGLILPFFKKIDGEIHHYPRYEKYPRMMGVGVLPQVDDESERIFTTLVSRNAINLHAPFHSVGVVFQNQEAEDIRAKIQKLLLKVEVF